MLWRSEEIGAGGCGEWGCGGYQLRRVRPGTKLKFTAFAQATKFFARFEPRLVFAWADAQLFCQCLR